MDIRRTVQKILPLALSIPFFWIALVMEGCDLFPDTPPENEVFDAPLDGLTGTQMSLHLAGDEEFGRRFTTGEGVGPIFIATSCDACHPGEARGHPTFDVVRFGRMDGNVFDPMIAQGGPQLQNRSIPGYPAEEIPSGATGIARLTPPSVTGLGFLEAVDDATIWAMADPDDADGDGISGRPQLIEESDLIAEIVAQSHLVDNGTRNIPVGGRYIGRFGKKGVSINLLHQTVSAYIEDMGLTTDLIPNDLTNVQEVGSAGEDTVPDPEISSSIVSNVVFYLRTLRQPLRRNENDPDVRAGEQLFEQIKCTSCHVPTLETGVSNIPQLSEKEFHPYTDLLLHDMGSELDDGFTEGRATTSEWRTPPLWGLGLAEPFQGGRAYYLHDGRATSLEEAIQFHGGEASGTRAAFNALSEAEK
ncbi:MAG: di-heme oxidoredictase family protein, partial [Rubricoccaceae bacterium]|nr:di-heme oxidoredictase family protein [Rubricoccaceae bacterium]